MEIFPELELSIEFEMMLMATCLNLYSSPIKYFGISDLFSESYIKFSYYNFKVMFLALDFIYISSIVSSMHF